MSMSSPNWPSRSSRFGNGGGGGDSLVKTQQWRFQTVREQNWWPSSIGGFGSFGPPLEERRFERILQERSLRVWERSSSQPHQHQQTMAVVSLRELPIERRRPPPPPPRTRQPPPSSIPVKQTAAPAINGHGHPTQKEQVLVQQQQIQEEVQWRGSGQSQNGGMPTAGIRIGQQPTAPAEKPPSRIVEYSSKQAAVNVEPEEEITNEPDGFRIRVEARGFGNEDFKISLNASRVLALDAEHVEDNGNGTITIRKLNRRWKLADDIDQRSIHAYMGADQHIMILGLKVSAEAPTTTNMEEENKAAADGPEEEMNVQQMNVVQQEQFFPAAVDDSDQGSVQQAPPSTPAAMPSMSEEHQQYQRL